MSSVTQFSRESRKTEREREKERNYRHFISIVFYMIELVNSHMLSHRNSRKCDNSLVGVVGRSLEKVVGYDFDSWLICY